MTTQSSQSSPMQKKRFMLVIVNRIKLIISSGIIEGKYRAAVCRNACKMCQFLKIAVTDRNASFLRHRLHTEKSFQNLVKSNRNQIVSTIFRMIWNTSGRVHLCFKSIGKW